MRKISLEKIDSLFSAIAENNVLYMPVDTKTGAKYEKWEDGKKLSDSLNTVRSAKDFFFPQTENLMDFKVEGKKIEVIDTRSETEDFVVFGVRACDVKSFDVLDKVFLAEPQDSYYKNRREHGVIMSLACTKPNETCFCTTFGIDAAEPAGDVVCYKTEEALYMDAKTEKGKKLLKALEGITEEADNKAVTEQQKVTRERMAKLPLANLKADAFGDGKTKEFIDRPEWKELSESCLGCGTCMYSEFTKMSAGQPRLTQLERFRQRFMHKLVYFPTNNDGMFSCVGCGRCLAKCPIQMNIVKVMKKLGGNTNG